MPETGDQPNHHERRRRPRLRLTRSLIARYGAQGVVIVDIHDFGARIEHFAPHTPGKTATLVFEWKELRIEAEATVVSCRVHRFSSAEHGGTVYQSGLSFASITAETRQAVRELMATAVARSMAEQVANLRGLGPVTEREMPVFRSDGGVAGEGVDDTQTGRRRIPVTRVHTGYFRCALLSGRRWDRRWTADPRQPDDGFTILATEPRDLVEMLCEDYRRMDDATRRLIRLLARITVEDGP